MQARLDWVLIIFGTQVIKKKRPVQLVFPDYLSISDDYGVTHTVNNLLDFNQLMSVRLIKSAVLHLIKTKNPSN